MAVVRHTAEALEIVSFSAGAFRFAVDARQVNRMLDVAPESAVAIETLLGLPVVEAAHRRCLLVGKHCVEVSDPINLRLLSFERINPLPELVAARIQINGVRALALDVDGAMLLLDLLALLARIDNVKEALNKSPDLS